MYSGELLRRSVIPRRYVGALPRTLSSRRKPQRVHSGRCGAARRGGLVLALEDRCAWTSRRADLNSGEGRETTMPSRSPAPSAPGDRAIAPGREPRLPSQPPPGSILRRACCSAWRPSTWPATWAQHLAAARRPAVDVVAQEPPREVFRAPAAAFEFLDNERQFISRELLGQHLPTWEPA